MKQLLSKSQDSFHQICVPVHSQPL